MFKFTLSHDIVDHQSTGVDFSLSSSIPSLGFLLHPRECGVHCTHSLSGLPYLIFLFDLVYDFYTLKSD